MDSQRGCWQAASGSVLQQTCAFLLSCTLRVPSTYTVFTSPGSKRSWSQGNTRKRPLVNGPVVSGRVKHGLQTDPQNDDCSDESGSLIWSRFRSSASQPTDTTSEAVSCDLDHSVARLGLAQARRNKQLSFTFQEELTMSAPRHRVTRYIHEDHQQSRQFNACHQHRRQHQHQHQDQRQHQHQQHRHLRHTRSSCHHSHPRAAGAACTVSSSSS